MNEALKPSTQKIAIVEFNIGNRQDVCFNRQAFVYYVIFSAIYPLIDPAFLTGVAAQSIVTVGSVSSDAALLTEVASIDACQALELSYFCDAANLALYFHLQNGDEPSLHNIVIGMVIGVSKHAGVYNGSLYEGRLKSAFSLRKSRDPLFYGLVSYVGGTFVLDNIPAPGEDVGPYDALPELLYFFGNKARALFGFGGQAYSEFARVGCGLIEDVNLGPDELSISVRDYKASFANGVLINIFDVVTYPDIKPGNIGKYIPVAYGVLTNAPVLCTNEAKLPAPATYSFTLADTTYHALHALTVVRVDGVAKAVAASDLTAGTFSLVAANYSPGQEVTADFEGYEDDLGDLISNALDVIKDILVNYQGLVFISSLFNIPEWTAITALAPDVCYFASSQTEVKQVIELICSAARVYIIVQDNELFTAKKYAPDRPAIQSFELLDLLEIPTIEYNVSEILAEVSVGYAKDWANNDYRRLLYDDLSDEVFERYKTRKPKSFDTLLTTVADALAFAIDIMSVSAYAKKTFPARFKVQPLGREIGDHIRLPVTRRNGMGLLGTVKAEIIELDKNLDKAEITCGCRVISIYLNTVDQRGWYYGINTYYGAVEGGARYSLGGPQEI